MFHSCKKNLLLQSLILKYELFNFTNKELILKKRGFYLNKITFNHEN